ncbi:MAG: hypothetical protein EON60_02885 [Alphaproteobacteria bacterium]|nr:MAG: hypothetical protein EON60_02885 [Alphaproteobacteria bacterium]
MGIEVFMEKGSMVGGMADGEVYQKARKGGADHEKAMQVAEDDQNAKRVAAANSGVISTASRKFGF